MKTSRLKYADTGGLIAMIGASCRLPGASSLDDFWRLLVQEKNVIQPRPSGRWSVERFLREGEPSPGFSYSFAGGYLDDPFQFDPTPFGISLREAAQTDPQQRLLLELVWQAFEDAGVSPDQWKGRKAGVYVGASNIDYQGAAALDVSVIESHFATGNSLSILANRISYVFDFKGPSLTVDTACSSSLVALGQAIAALEAGDIDFAVVAGVNLLLSPTPFIGFAQARMLSPTGRSRPFSADADGYVRAEGGVVVLLSRGDDAVRQGLRVRSNILGCAVNSDGLTAGIALPSSEGQRRLIEDLYAALGLDPDALAFVEAHGTGTQAGDPIESLALGQALGLRRRKPLTIGSVKSNVGHLEAASGLVGFLKASLALEYRLLPRSLFSERLNPAIDFAGLNLDVARRALPLHLDGGPGFAGVCNYGFGGTNAHLVLRSATPAAASPPRFIPGASLAGSGGEQAKIIILSAASPDALKARALQVCAQIEAGVPASVLAAAYVRQQPLMAYRLATAIKEDAALAGRLRLFAETSQADPDIALGSQRAGLTKCAFIFSGNGSQFPEMGLAAYANNADFRHEIHLIDKLFKPFAGWSIEEVLRRGHDPDRAAQTSFAQPVIFAIQSALAAVMARYGVCPAIVLGHSIGEVAAAESCGAITREQALRIVFHRSNLQESVRGKGGMLVVAADGPLVVAEIRACGAALEIAALNSQISTTIVGPYPEIRAFARHCRARRIAAVELDLDYPFHSAALDQLEASIIEKLSGVVGREGRATFISTVSGRLMSGTALDPVYWWRNLRSAVRFHEAVDEALRQGANLFVELGPHPILGPSLKEIFGAEHGSVQSLATLAKTDAPGSDPVLRSLAHLVANGVCFDEAKLVGTRPSPPIPLPPYPFQRQRSLLETSSESLTAFGAMFASPPRHPLLGARMAEGSPEWRNLVDSVLIPYLADHRVNGAVVMPASGLVEMALAVGRDLHGDAALALDDFDILNALLVSADETREVSTRYAEATGTVEIWSRRRFAGDRWLLHARGRVSVATEACLAPLAGPIPAQARTDTPSAVYAEARRYGVEYGKLFQLITHCERDEFTAHVSLDPPLGGLGAFSDIHVLHPVSLDAAFHALSVSRPQRGSDAKTHLPIRFRQIRLFKQGARVRQAITHLSHETERYKTLSISLLDEMGGLVAAAEGVVLRAVPFSQDFVHDRTFRRSIIPVGDGLRADALDVVRSGFQSGAISKAWLLTRAFCLSLARRELEEAMVESGASGLLALREHTLIATEARPFFDILMNVLAERSLLTQVGDDLIVSTSLDLPTPETLLSSMMQRCPEANFEIHAAAIVAHSAGPHLRSGDFIAPPVALKNLFESASCATAPSVTALADSLERLCARHGRKLRVLALGPGSMGLARALVPFVDKGLVEVTLAVTGEMASDLCEL